jgi:hypothetical protein
MKNKRENTYVNNRVQELKRNQTSMREKPSSRGERNHLLKEREVVI